MDRGKKSKKIVLLKNSYETKLGREMEERKIKLSSDRKEGKGGMQN